MTQAQVPFIQFHVTSYSFSAPVRGAVLYFIKLEFSFYGIQEFCQISQLIDSVIEETACA
jgi:hypothetical protein